MSHEEIDSRLSPFDCIVCGSSIYGQNLSMRICLPCKCTRNGQCSIEKTQRYFSSSLAKMFIQSNQTLTNNHFVETNSFIDEDQIIFDRIRRLRIKSR